MIVLLLYNLLINTKQFDQLNITFLLGYLPDKISLIQNENDISN